MLWFGFVFSNGQSFVWLWFIFFLPSTFFLCLDLPGRSCSCSFSGYSQFQCSCTILFVCLLHLFALWLCTLSRFSSGEMVQSQPLRSERTIIPLFFRPQDMAVCVCVRSLWSVFCGVNPLSGGSLGRKNGHRGCLLFTQCPPHSWPEHAQMSCRLAESTATEC